MFVGTVQKNTGMTSLGNHWQGKFFEAQLNIPFILLYAQWMAPYNMNAQEISYMFHMNVLL